MTKSELPQKLFIPGVQMPQGIVDIQIKDDNNRMVALAWGGLESATRWLQPHGLELWKKHRGGLPNGEVVIREVARDELFTLYKMIGRKLLHFEPDVGRLFAPAARQIEP